ncbi:UDP-N-acetylmuramoyl-L-alanine--D-glutamate ligase [Nitrospina watsonii]|uniref:UDP-N-acetylmuramoylalanine--D-glutamate ligase n=1 Tax=Nitrospina watsonii TaxID=1323948 RepID=A0ABN8VXX2_9BACT|nr:UDP-N-acetylmuramoyl-L-alanine--D-glutamate ligase [Nitrospina watsonii]CAI2717697.1 UDP-N-acetylmuramoylalanine--D-glutamate ligase [Nitrospina watsonii]
MDLNGKSIAIVGLARTGIATANFLAAHGAKVTVYDQKPRAELEHAVAQLADGIDARFETSAPESDAPEGSALDLIVLSPGVDIHNPALEPLRKCGVDIVSELELASRLCTTPIIAITGTNGKTTTTSLIAALLQNAGYDVKVGGNIGVPFVALIDPPPKDYMVLEVSSFQLEGASTFHPFISVILNLTPDHLDRHGSMEHYAALKGRIAANQTENDWMVVNADDPWVKKMAEDQKAEPVWFSTQREILAGAYMEERTACLQRGGAAIPVVELDDLKPALARQMENVLAAIATAYLAGVDPAAMLPTLREFESLPHRLEWVRTLNGVDFINDSKGTNIGAVEKSLKSFDRPVILIIGGKDKGSDFSLLTKAFRRGVKHMVLIGEARQKIQAVLNGSFVYEEADSMDAAVKAAYAAAEPGDVVLLSPACASFDMFRDYADRGDRFRDCVNRL